MQTELPETRLLNLIKRKAKARQEPDKSKFKLKRKFSFAFLKGLFSESLLINRKFLEASHKVLKTTLLLLLGYFALSFIFPLWREGSLAKLPAAQPGYQETEPASAPFQPQDYSAYLKEIGAKQLFAPNFAEGQLQAESEINLSAKFSLVGIISGDHPQAVIEDKEAQKTYYLKVGQSFSGIKVEAINEGKVVINYHGRQAELLL